MADFGTDPFSGGNAGMNMLAQTPRQPNPFANSPALQTAPSNLEKLFDVLNKPGAAEDQMVINLINGNPATQGVGDILGWNDNASFLRNLDNLVSSNNTYQPTGGDVIQALRGGADPETTLGKVAQSVGGFVLNVLNPADPLNWLGIGELTDTGRALEKAGTAVPFFKGLAEGNRSLLSAVTPFSLGMAGLGDKVYAQTPDAINKAAGQFSQGVGNAVMKIPGIEPMVNAFKPTFDKLKQFANIATSGASKIFGDLGGEEAGRALKQTFRDAVEEVGEGALERANKPMASYYKSQGYNPTQIANAEIRRMSEKPIAVKNAAKDPYLKEIAKTVPYEGPTTPHIQAIHDAVQKGLKATQGIRKAAGLPNLGEGYFPRFLSDARKKQFSDLGIDVEHGERVLKEFTHEQLSKIAKDPVGRAKLYSEYFATPQKKAASSPHIMDVLKQADPQAAAIYEDDAIQSYGRHLKQTAQEASTSDALQGMLSIPSIARPHAQDWDGTGKQVVPVDIPSQFHKAFEKSFPGEEVVSGEKTGEFKHQVWVPADTAHEFRNFVGIFSKQDQANRAMGAFGAGWRTLTGIYKKLTLLTPLGGLHTALRDHIGNHFQSYMAGAWSPKGNAIAAKLAQIVAKTEGNPKKFIEEAAKLGEHYGLDLGQELALMKTSNLFEEGFTKAMFGGEHFNAAEKALGMGAISKLRKTSEDFSRIQHYFTRRLQGWSPTGAVNDVRKVLYDYVGGLSPFEKKLQNIFPFYAWSRFNIPSMVEAALRHPGRAEAMYRAKENIEGKNGPDERALDEYVKGDPHIRLWQDKNGKWTYLRLKGFLPLADLEDITSMEKFGDFAVSALNPMIKTPAENYFNASTFFKTAGGANAPIEEYPGQTGSFLGMNVPRKDINILRNIRPLNEINRLIPSQGHSTLGPFEYGLSSTGLNLTPVDMGNATEHAKYAYQKTLSNLKMAYKRQQQTGRPTTDVQALMDQLKAQSYQPGVMR